MKKNLFFLAVAAVALASCSSDDTIAENSNVGNNQPKEIAISPLTQKATRVATAVTTDPIANSTYPNELSMQVAAYAFPGSATTWTGGGYFDKTQFDGTGDSWTGSRYWPLTDAYVTFLAVAGVPAANVSFTASTFASGGTVTYSADTNSDNVADNSDLMYSGKQEHVVQNGNTLTYPDDVDMVFKHALSWLQFKVKAANSTYASKIHVKNIVINTANTAGTFTITNTGYETVGDPTPSGTWGSLTTNNIGVKAGTQDLTLTDGFVEYGNALIIPEGSGQESFAKFTIYYSIDGKDYTFDYTPASLELLQTNKYIYNITFTLTEIIIDPEVDTWTDGGSTYIDIPSKSFAYAESASAGTYSVENTAGTYTFTVTGLAASTQYDLSIEDDVTWITTSSSVTSDENGIAKVTFAVAAQENNAATRTKYIKLLKHGDTPYTTVSIAQAAGPVVP